MADHQKVASLKISAGEKALYRRLGKAEGRGWSSVMKAYAFAMAANVLGMTEEELRRQADAEAARERLLEGTKI